MLSVSRLISELEAQLLIPKLLEVGEVRDDSVQGEFVASALD